MLDHDALLRAQPRLMQWAAAHRAAYAAADPFPHIVVDAFLPPALLEHVLAEFPAPHEGNWQRFETANEKKLANRLEADMGPQTRLLLYQLNGSGFIQVLETLTGISGLIPDPHYGGGGLHQIERGGRLEVHADFNVHPTLLLDRRINLLLYLNKDWPEAYGGHLELWNADLTQCRQRILPCFNRCVIFNTTSTSFHGHPEPLRCPKDRTRKSLALYYYTRGRPEAEQTPAHTTLFKTRK